jgi:hypothetical protein
MPSRIDLPDLLFEVQSWAGFLDTFGHFSERRTRTEGPARSPWSRCQRGDPQHRPDSSHRPGEQGAYPLTSVPVDQNYLRADTIAAANAALITAQSRIELAQIWGGRPARLRRRPAASSSFPMKSINTRPSPKYDEAESAVD